MSGVIIGVSEWSNRSDSGVIIGVSGVMIGVSEWSNYRSE